DLEVSKADFIQSDQAVAVIANRYDGIDFPDDDCRLSVCRRTFSDYESAGTLPDQPHGCEPALQRAYPNARAPGDPTLHARPQRLLRGAWLAARPARDHLVAVP